MPTRPAGRWADARPSDHDDPDVLSRIAPCNRCGHDEHVTRCLALVDPVYEDVLCPCRGGVPLPGVFATPRSL